MTEDQDSIKVTAKKEPWSPFLICVLSLFLTIVAGSLLHAWNFERLGFPQKKHKAYYTNTFLILLLIFFHFSYLTAFAFIMQFLVLIYFYKSQINLYETHLAKGGLKGGLKFPIFFSLAIGLSFYLFAYVTDRAAHWQEYQIQSYIENEQWEKAEKALIEQINKHAYRYQDPTPDYQLAYVLYQLKEFKRARNIINNHLELRPSDERALELKAKIEEQLKEMKIGDSEV